MTFDHIVNWKLLKGSHDFPGPDGGTCINEAAIIAAGFAYKAVRSPEDCPPCFSRPLARFAIFVNDALLDDRRQRLIPYVTRLAGTADTPEIEAARAEYLIIGMFQKVYPLILRAMKLPNEAARCEAVATLADARKAALAVALAHDLAHALALAVALAHDLAHAFDLALALAHDLAHAFDLAEPLIALLDGALKIGRQAEPADGALITERLEAARTLAPVA